MLGRLGIVFYLMLAFALAFGEKVDKHSKPHEGGLVYHVSLQGATQLGSCKITHKATREEPYILTTCQYRCDRPVADLINVKDMHENIRCHKDETSPPAQGQSVEDDK